MLRLQGLSPTHLADPTAARDSRLSVRPSVRPVRSHHLRFRPVFCVTASRYSCILIHLTLPNAA